MSDLLIQRVAPGVARVTTIDPFDSLELHRINRSAWQATPASPGVYLLYGLIDAEAAVYVGMSTTDMRGRIRSHHVTVRKNWFGVLFAVPLPSSLLCQAVEAELIRSIQEAGVVAIVENRAQEERFLDSADVHVQPALNKIANALEMLLGSDIFTPAEADEPAQVDATQVDAPQRAAHHARQYRASAEQPRERAASDPLEATHAYVGAGIQAWGSFTGDEPDHRFRVLAESTCRPPTLDPSQASYKLQAKVGETQRALQDEGVLDEQLRFTRDHIFESWSRAAQVVSGKGTYSGGYHWQRLGPQPAATPVAPP